MKKTLPLVRLLCGVVLLTFGTGFVTPVVGQEIPDTGGRVVGSVGGSFGDGDGAVVSGGAAGLRLTRRLGIDFEVFHVTGLERDDDRFFIQQLGFAPRLNRDGSVTAFMSKVVVDFPVGDRVIPFVAGGGGIGRLSERFDFDFDGRLDIDRPVPADRPNVGPGRPLIFPPFPRDFDRSTVGLALTIGGGVDVRLWKGMTIGGETRWLRLLTDHDTLDVVHVLSRIAYRF